MWKAWPTVPKFEHVFLTHLIHELVAIVDVAAGYVHVIEQGKNKALCMYSMCVKMFYPHQAPAIQTLCGS